MSMVRFATLCDYCGQRSEEYSSWASCRVCGDHCCPAHRFPGSTRDADLDSPETCLCLRDDCADESNDGE